MYQIYNSQDMIRFINACRTDLELNTKDPNLTFPKSLPICVLEAVFSMGVRNTSSHNAFTRYMDYYNLKYDSSTGKVTPEHTISNFIENLEAFSSFDEVAKDVLKNSQRTSSRNGILKAKAAYEVAKTLKEHSIETINDFNQKAYSDSSLNDDICNVKGQSSGIMLKYLYMLAGDSSQAKPDRMLKRYIENIIPTACSDDDVQKIMTEAVKTLKLEYPDLTVRLLDFLIWDYQRKTGKS